MTSTSSQSAIACIYALTVPFIMAIPNCDTETLTSNYINESNGTFEISELVGPQNMVLISSHFFVVM